MKRPDFLVIGAMKAGSTTLYEDLYGHRDVYLPDKELGFLLDEQITSAAGQRRYDALFQSARPGQLVGDVSADYAKLPEAEGMAERAVELLGNRLRVVYSVRNPIDRVVSQHHHELSYRTISDPDIDRVVRTEPKLIAFSSYARQLEPYRRLVGDEQIKVLCFERYMQDRRAGFADLASFLGLAEQVTSTDPHRAFNAAESNTLPTASTRRLLQSSAYRKLVRPLLSKEVRTALRRRILRAVPPRPAPPSAATIDYLFDTLGDDVAALASTGFVVPDSWSREATHARYEVLRSQVVTSRPQ